jgi:hypothetical protein
VRQRETVDRHRHHNKRNLTTVATTRLSEHNRRPPTDGVSVPPSWKFFQKVWMQRQYQGNRPFFLLSQHLLL